MRRNYYEEIRKFLPTALVKQLAKLAHAQLVRQDPSLSSTSPGNILALKVSLFVVGWMVLVDLIAVVIVP